MAEYRGIRDGEVQVRVARVPRIPDAAEDLSPGHRVSFTDGYASVLEVFVPGVATPTQIDDHPIPADGLPVHHQARRTTRPDENAPNG